MSLNSKKLFLVLGRYSLKPKRSGERLKCIVFFLLFFCLSHSFALSSLFTHGIIGLYRIPNSIGRKLWEHTYATEDRGLLRLPSGDGAAAAAVLHNVKKKSYSSKNSLLKLTLFSSPFFLTASTLLWSYTFVFVLLLLFFFFCHSDLKHFPLSNFSCMFLKSQ